ncbi:hypothetical protein PHMEG_00015003 [Phytophthora megakarya]|uniref:Myb/SANT-like domain-containing protein n=1 Tax=Phytophthora megakarya TaxID=4795 RepID=A0A225W2V8_9STRA|nr:hypothetical protein PHMEG_00015003 [Phytophthora megakarya]
MTLLGPTNLRLDSSLLYLIKLLDWDSPATARLMKPVWTQLNSKVADLKKKYKTYSAMKNNSGFGWDPQTDAPIAPESVWEAILAEHPQAREFKARPL